jgi:hypothetical protein
MLSHLAPIFYYYSKLPVKLLYKDRKFILLAILEVQRHDTGISFVLVKASWQMYPQWQECVWE